MRRSVVLDGSRILDLLLDIGKNRGWLAEVAGRKVGKKEGFTVRAIGNAVNGKPVSEETAKAIALALGVSLDALLPTPFDLPLLSTRGFPTEVGAMVRSAHEAEMSGNPLKAADLFGGAGKLLKQLNPSAMESLTKLRDRQFLNDQWGKRVRVAVQGKTDPSRIKVVDVKNRVVGSATKDEAHRNGLLHHTVILALRTPDRRVVCERRDKEKSYPGALDFLGGHSRVGDAGPLHTALREANEELSLFLGKHKVRVEEEWLQQIGKPYQFNWDIPTNRERSTLFIVTIPPHPALRLKVLDEKDNEADKGEDFVEMRTETHVLSELVELCRRKPQEFADGARRVLLACDQDSKVQRALYRLFK